MKKFDVNLEKVSGTGKGGIDPHCYTSNLNQGDNLNQLKVFLYL